MSGIPKEVIVTYKEIAGALNNSIEQIEEAHSWIRQIINNMFGEMSNNHIFRIFNKYLFTICCKKQSG